MKLELNCSVRTWNLSPDWWDYN